MPMSDEQRTVWVIEQGEYSDYRVVGVFSSRAHAQLVVDAMTAGHEDMYDKPTIAEWPLDPAVDALRQGFRKYTVLMLRDGTVERVSAEDTDGHEIAGYVSVWHRSTAPANIGKNIPDALQVDTWARDETHAIKIANDHRLQMIADGRWA